MDELVFGPVPSRRLGRSIGVNNIPHKVCSYSCAYCQVGKGGRIQVERQEFYKPDTLIREVEQKLKLIKPSDYPDYITIVPDGEPTLDINLGTLIAKLKNLGVPVAVITNSSMLYRDDVKKDLALADYVSLKVDTVNPSVWKRINKPHKQLSLDKTLCAIVEFAQAYSGEYVTETMLVKDMNTLESELTAVAQFLQQVRPNIAYLSIPTRPPAYKGTFPPSEEMLLKAHELFSWHCLNVEYLTAYEGNTFAATGRFEDDLLGITAVHPMRLDAVRELMAKTSAAESTLNGLMATNRVKQITYEGQVFVVRSFDK
ncbi:MAG: radical SAM protein [Bacteroidales bacterium]|nr:radical SAM protein [Bacteroidales bacterium]